jgi:hypothetical protein
MAGSWERWRLAGEFRFSACDWPAGRRRSQEVHAGELFAVSLKNLRRDLSDGGPQNQKSRKPFPLLSAFASGFGAIASKRSEDGGERIKGEGGCHPCNRCNRLCRDDFRITLSIIPKRNYAPIASNEFQK